MNTVEFFGLPASGKSLIVEKLVKSFKHKKKISSYRALTINELRKQKKISFFEYFFWIYMEKKREKRSSIKSKSVKKNFLTQVKEKLIFFFPKREVFLRKVDDLFLEYKSRHINYINNLNKILEKYNKKEEFKNILDWIKFEIIGYELSKKNPDIVLINSEGFYQRSLSFLIRANISDNDLESYIRSCPKIKQLNILINKDLKKKTIENILKSKKQDFKFNRKFIKKYFFIIRNLKKQMNVNLYFFYFNEIEKTYKIIKKKINT